MSGDIFGLRLRPGSHLRVIAPSRSLQVVSDAICQASLTKLQSMGFEVSIGSRARKTGLFATAPPEDRLQDLHEAFSDRGVDGVLSAVGGWRCNDLLSGIDWKVIRNNPKVFCGYSDITVLLNAIWRQTSLVTYSGPHFSSFAMEDLDDYQARAFLDAVSTHDVIDVRESPTWSDDVWYEQGKKRSISPSNGWCRIRDGKARGHLIGGNFSTFLLLQGTHYTPTLTGSVLLIEDIKTIQPAALRRSLISLTMLPGFADLQGIIFGRFQRASGLDSIAIHELVDSLTGRYQEIPILSDFDAGHTQPIVTLPIGGVVELLVGDHCEVKLLSH